MGTPVFSGAAGPLLVLGLMAAACGDSVVAPDSDDDAATPETGRRTPDAGRREPSIALPVLTPCAEGWEERFDDELGIPVCEPWPDFSPITWPCPEGWQPVTERGVSVCEPWPDSSPVKWDCPEGWRQIVDDGVETCDPFPEGGPGECGPYEVQYPGDPECTAVGTECPLGYFPEDLPSEANLIYVQSGFQGGDGVSPASPLGSLDQVDFDGLTSGTVVALAKGTYPWAGRLSRDVTLWGACPAETFLTAPATPSTEPALVAAQRLEGVEGAEVVVKNLTITDPGGPGLLVQGLLLRVEGIVVERAQGAGVSALPNGTLSARDLLVRDTRPTSDGRTGHGLRVLGGSARVAKAVFDQSRQFGVLQSGGSFLILEDVIVRNTESQTADRLFGGGLSLTSGGTAEVRRAVFERNRDIGVSVVDEGTRLFLEDTIVRDTRSREVDQRSGRGLNVVLGASVEVRRASFVRNRELGVFVGGEDARLVLEDAVVRDTGVQAGRKEGGRGLGVELGGKADVRRSAFLRNQGLGVAAFLPNAQLALEDVLIRDNQGRGLNVQEGASVEVRRALVEANRGVGVFAGSPDTRTLIEDTVVRDTESEEVSQEEGRGLNVQAGASVEVRRALLANNRSIGAFVSDALLSMEDVTVRDTRSQTSDLEGGRGLNVENGATATVRRTVVERNRDVGIFVEASELLLEDSIVRDTQSRASDRTFGFGLLLQKSATATVRRALIERNLAFGISLEQSVQLLAEDIVVRDTMGGESDLLGGPGLLVRVGATATVSRALFERNRTVGISTQGSTSALDLAGLTTALTLEDAVIRDTRSDAVGSGRGLTVATGAVGTVRRTLVSRNQDLGIFVFLSRATLSDVVVDGVDFAECSDPQCLRLAHGVVNVGGRLILDRTRVARASQCGVFLAASDELDGSETVITKNGVGLCVADALYDTARLDAEFVDNDERLIFDELPPPPQPIDFDPD